MKVNLMSFRAARPAAGAAPGAPVASPVPPAPGRGREAAVLALPLAEVAYSRACIVVSPCSSVAAGRIVSLLVSRIAVGGSSGDAARTGSGMIPVGRSVEEVNTTYRVSSSLER